MICLINSFISFYHINKQFFSFLVNFIITKYFEVYTHPWLFFVLVLCTFRKNNHGCVYFLALCSFDIPLFIFRDSIKKKESVTFTKVQKKVSITHQGKCKIKFRKKLHESGPVRDTPSTKNRDVTFHIHIHILFSFI